MPSPASIPKSHNGFTPARKCKALADKWHPDTTTAALLEQRARRTPATMSAGR
ncbi:hypothetical protein F4553_002487 [Allocatelliglobosispora scoriae]|uniref:Uncharacterized protein n=1 Tax=Allocatelliglobosispora scoriae TaxID=643052 RepID=A0A841BNZ2_9ACTN|nr:hypothetical protein [Allocatelliglobosispora scoriae]MBB5869108.1 hypothetical protein [Allocatelliglobosispora scoriae]